MTTQSIWPPEKKIVVELRKSLRTSATSPKPLPAELFDPPVPVPGMPDQLAVARLSVRAGDLFFTRRGMVLIAGQDLDFVPYSTIRRADWIASNPEEKVRLKRDHADRFFVSHSGGTIEISGFGGWGIQPLHNFFTWLARRNGHLSAGQPR